MTKIRPQYINREISWLSFNDRVLQEAADQKNPLIERMKFLGIFSSNLDEFFRVRVGTLKRIVKARKKAKVLLGEDPVRVLNDIQKIVIHQQNKFDDIYENILKEFEKKRVFIINEKQLNCEQRNFVKNYFHQKIRPTLFPITISYLSQFPVLKDHSIYLAVRLMKSKKFSTVKHALMEVPVKVVSRFLVLPKKDENVYIILLDDVIRIGLKDIFSVFGFTKFDAYTMSPTTVLH
ncbi:hypothetical protein ACFL1R_13200 [Candidatus Latescibacterota bacterium]